MSLPNAAKLVADALINRPRIMTRLWTQSLAASILGLFVITGLGLAYIR